MRQWSSRQSTIACSLSGGRTWWAHLEFTPINIELTILPKTIEEQLFLARLASVDGGLVCGSRGKSQAVARRPSTERLFHVAVVTCLP